jgi:DNA-binding MarR family transcriptional regulator
MEPSHGLKQHLHDRYLRFLHLHERLSETEIDQFFHLAEEHSIKAASLNITSVHVIDCIGRHEPINSTAIAERMELSKASITKISGKLLADGLVKRTQLKDNRKEIYFRLTVRGRKVFELHNRLHQTEAARFQLFLDRYSDEELTVIRHFLQDFNVELEQKLAEGVTFT